MTLFTGKVKNNLISLTAFFLPINSDLTFLFIASLFLLNIYDKSIVNLSKIKQNYLLIILFASYIFGMVYTENIYFGMKNVESKLPLLIIPFSLTHLKKRTNLINQVMEYFSLGNLLAVLLLLAKAMIRQKLDFKCLEFFEFDFSSLYYFGSNYSAFIHPSYFALFLSISIIYALQNIKKVPFKSSAMIIVFLGGIFFCNSLMGNIVLVLILIFLLIFTLVKKEYLFKFFIIFLGVSIFSYFTLKEKVDQNYYKYYTSINTENPSSINIRLLIWKEAWIVMKNNFFLGVGTGDGRDELIKMYKNQCYDLFIVKKYNPHNQYIQTHIEIGLTGIIILLTILLKPFFILKKRPNDILFYTILLACILHMMAESILETKSGIVFFAFFYSVFTLSLNQDESSVLPTQN